MLLLRTAGRLGFTRRAPPRRSQLFSKRPHSSRPEIPRTQTSAEGPSKISTSSPTITGPAWIWTVPLNSYTRLHTKRPYTVQIVSTLVVYLAGDVAAQFIVPSAPSEVTSGSTTLSSYDPL